MALRDDDGNILGIQATEHEDGTVTLSRDGVSITVEQNAGAICEALAGFGQPAVMTDSTPFQTVNGYPLYCIDRGDRVDPERQYLGPYTTHDEALGNTEDPRDLVRRCRQLRPNEIAFDRDAAALAEYEVFSALVDELDEAACTGNLPEGAWHRVGQRTVFDKFDDGTLPTARDYDTWVDDHLSVDAWICEGDE